MKSSKSISNWIADVVVILCPVGNITVSGIMVYTIAGSFAANLQLTNDCIAPVSSITSTVNPWVYTAKYNRSHCICMLLSDGFSTFPTYLTSASCISFPDPSLCFMPILLNFSPLLIGGGFQLGLCLFCCGFHDASRQYLAIYPIFPQL